MDIIKILKFLYNAKNEHFIYVTDEIYKKWKYLLKLFIHINPNYINCQIYRKKYKNLRNFVVIGLKYSGKNVKRRTNGYAKEFIKKHHNATCLYCEVKLNEENATTDHIIPISMGGNNTQVNLIVCCKSCNSERGNIEFRKYLSAKNKMYRDIKFI
jgi:hypothetical protein